MKHEVQISLAYDEKTKTHAMAVFVGPFSSKDEADAYAKEIKEFLEREAGASISRVQ